MASRAIGKFERLYLERQQRDLATGAQRGLTFDPAAGERVIAFIETYCRHWKGEWAGQLIKLEEWQKGWIRILFGWKRADGTRRFRRAWVEMCRKNAKTTIAAAIALYMLVADGEPGAECYATATAKEQARILLNDSIQMVQASPELKRFVSHMRSGGGTLVCERLQSRMTSLSSDAGTKDGLSPHFDGRDEVHEWTDHELAAKLDTAMGARRQPLTLEITTAGVYDPKSVGWQHHDYACQVLEQLFEDDRFFAFIAAVDEEDDPLNDPTCWEKANPNLGVSCKLDFLAEQVREAKNQPSEANKVFRMHFGRWTAQTTRWLDVDAWRSGDPISGKAAVESRAAREAALAGRECWGGLDLAKTSDLMAFVLEFPDADDVIHLLARFWVPEATIERELKKKGRRHYRDWVDQGWLTATPGNVADYKRVRAEINALCKVHKVRQVAFDKWSATQIVTELGEDDGIEMVECGQGYASMSAPSKDFEARVQGGRVRHGGNPVLTWCVTNAVAKTDPAGNIKPDREKAKDKIDGVVAAIMAHSRVILSSGGGGSYLDSGGGLLVLG